MFGIRNRRERAFKDIVEVVSTQEILTTSVERIKLPDIILERALSLINETEADGCERAVSFRFKRRGWSASEPLLGSRPDPQSLGAGMKLPFHRAIWRPHVALHTHPSGATLRRQIEENITKGDSWATRGIAAEEMEAFWAYVHAYPTVPSDQDVLKAMLGTGYVVGDMVSSRGGNFMMLAERHGINPLLGLLTGSVHTKISALQRAVSELKETADDYLRTPIEEIAGQVMQTRVVAAAGTLACYYSDDISSPYLERVEP